MLSVSILRYLAGMMRLRIVCAGIMQQFDSSNDRAGGQSRRPAGGGVATTFAQAVRRDFFHRQNLPHSTRWPAACPI